jgi:hypothetical protein
MKRWVRASLAVLGVALLGTALLVWWSAEQALGPAPEVHTSAGGGLSRCGYRPGLTSCDPPELSGGTIAVIVVLAVAGVGVLAAVVVDLVRARRARAG